MALAVYNYNGGGYELNRRIIFSRASVLASSIQAQVFELRDGVVGALLATVPGTRIQVEMQSTTQKANDMMVERATGEKLSSGPAEVTLASRTISQQDGILKQLAPNSLESGKRIDPVPDATGRIGGLNIYDPR